MAAHHQRRNITDPPNPLRLRPRHERPPHFNLLRRAYPPVDENDCADSPIEQETIASRIVLPESQLAKSAEADDDVTTTGPTSRHIPAVAAGPVSDNPTME
jgi:hypothetical protein